MPRWRSRDTIGLPELDIGTIRAWGSTVRLTRCVGRDQALDIILRAKKIDAAKALQIGLVQEVWPNDQLQQKAVELANELSAMPPYSVRGVLEAVLYAEQASLDDALALEREHVHKVSAGKHQMEGMMSFLEKRSPDFSSDPDQTLKYRGLLKLSAPHQQTVVRRHFTILLEHESRIACEPIDSLKITYSAQRILLHQPLVKTGVTVTGVAAAIIERAIDC
jgi:hypothetical protein